PGTRLAAQRARPIAHIRDDSLPLGQRGAQHFREQRAQSSRRGEIPADGLGLDGYSVIATLGENSATGFLAKDEFEATVDAFFAPPHKNIGGAEPAADAQARIIRAVELAVSQTLERADIAIVGHGGTGTLLYCHLAGVAIDRRYDQPATNGENWFAF